MDPAEKMASTVQLDPAVKMKTATLTKSTKGAVALRKKCGSLFLISKYPTTQKPDSKEPGFCCKIQLCH